MPKFQLIKFVAVVGVFILLIVCAQMVFSDSKAVRTTSTEFSAGAAYADALTSSTPVSAPANPGGISGMPGGPSDGTLPDPDGQTTQAAIPVSDSDIAMSPSVGMPAIQPTNPTSAPSTPAFTLTDVTNYYQQLYPQSTAQGYGAAGYQSTVSTSLVKAEFLTKKDLDAKGSFEINLPDDTLLCFVQYSGSFLLRTYQVNEPGTTISTQAPSTAPYALEVYDAHTGNVVLWGTSSSLK